MRTALLALAILLVSAASASAEDARPTPFAAPPGVESEPNGTVETASEIVSGERVRASSFPVGDVDHYRFTAEAGDRVFAATMTLASASGSNDSRLRLLGSDGTTLIEEDDDDGSLGPLSSTIAGAEIPAAGTYYL
jgi:predicted dehydrogenase